MNLFVAGWSASGAIDAAAAERALAGVLEDVPFLPGAELGSWRGPSGHAAAAWAQHDPERLGGVRYAAAERDRLALFAGRPIRWSGEEQADGRGPLDPGSYLRSPAQEWAPALDGRFAVVRAAGDGLQVVTDPLGAYPLFACRYGDTRWVSNNPELARRLARARELDRGVLASLLAGGWSLDGHPAWSGVERLPRGSLIGHEPGRGDSRRDLWPLSELGRLPGAGLDASAAARLLVGSLRALADWPGRPSVVPVTGGRDSRLILAAAVRSGIEFTAGTAGAPADQDVVAGRRLCAAVGMDHALIQGDPERNLLTHPEEAARLVAVSTGGTGTLADGSGYPMADAAGPPLLWHTGLAGEVARVAYEHTTQLTDRRWDRMARDAIVARLYRSFVSRRPGRTELVAPSVRPGLRGRIGAFVDCQLAAGVAPGDVPDAFYLLNRMALWCGPTQAAVEWVKDSTAAMWSPRMLSHLLGLSLDERAADRFHLHVLRELEPRLVDVPFEGGEGWLPVRGPRGRKAAHVRRLAGRGVAAARRRLATRSAASTSGPHQAADPFAAVHARVRDAAAERPNHPVWEVLDRPRAERLLARDTGELDDFNRALVWRLATVIWGLG